MGTGGKLSDEKMQPISHSGSSREGESRRRRVWGGERSRAEKRAERALVFEPARLHVDARVMSRVVAPRLMSSTAPLAAHTSHVRARSVGPRAKHTREAATRRPCLLLPPESAATPQPVTANPASQEEDEKAEHGAANGRGERGERGQTETVREGTVQGLYQYER